MNISIDQKLKTKLLEAEKIVFFTGAGISAESGIPTFRGEDGIWKKFKPEELANFNAFIRNPDMVWEWYQYRRKIINEAKPNPAHLAIAEFQNHYTQVSVITQNVDNLHGRAGSKIIYELHGNIERNFCIKCRTFYTKDNFTFTDKVPVCKCGGLIRPDVVWFGEALPTDIFNKAEKAAQWADLLFVIGTSAIVYPAAYIPMTAKQQGVTIIEINIEATDITSYANYSFFGKAGEVLPSILNEIISNRK